MSSGLGDGHPRTDAPSEPVFGQESRSGCAGCAAIPLGFIAVIAAVVAGLFAADGLGLFGPHPPSESEARRLVARLLCPEDPARALPRLIAQEVWSNEVSASRIVEVLDEQNGTVDERLKFYVSKDEGRAFVGRPDEYEQAYIEEARAACLAGEDLP